MSKSTTIIRPTKEETNIASRKDNSLESFIEVRRSQREEKIKARHSRTARYREKINSIVKA